jgi:hypothetical protein
MPRTSTVLALCIAALAGWACKSPALVRRRCAGRARVDRLRLRERARRARRPGRARRAAWEHAWRENHRRVLPVPPLPEVDFEREMVLAISIGPRPTAGYGVRIRSAHVQDGKLRVEAVETRPAAGAILPTVVTHPYAFVRVPRFEGDVLFELH